MYAQIDPTTFEKTITNSSQKRCGEQKCKITQMVPPTLRFGILFLEAFAIHFPALERLFGDLFSEPLQGTPTGDFGSPPGVILDPQGAILHSPRAMLVSRELFWHSHPSQ
jgi:hypothetical protein